jgi:hypothetical protein
MFDITTSRDYLAKLEADFDDYMKEPASARLALNCAITAYHLHEWVWGDWLKRNHDVQDALGISGNTNKERKESFLAWIDKACVWFSTIQDLANGAKHVTGGQQFQAMRIGAPPFMLDELGAGWGEGAWDGPIPYVAESHGDGHLLIDYGEGTGNHRWRTAGALLDVVVRFLREFFFRYHPDPATRAEVREWRLLL